MHEDLISVIIPVYNAEDTIIRCVDSVLKQTYTNIEIVLVDDGSKDNSPAICDDLARRYKSIVTIHKENGGQSSARNKGLEVSKGVYIGFVDDDDEIERDMYEILYYNLKSNKVLVSGIFSKLVYPKCTLIMNEGFESRIYSGSELAYNLFNNTGLVYGGVWDKLFDKTLFQDIRFPEKCELEDFWVMSNIYLRIDRIFVDSSVKYCWIQRKNSQSRSSYSEKSETYISIPQMIRVLYKGKSPDIMHALDFFVINSYYKYFTQVMRSKFSIIIKNRKKINCRQKEMKQELEKYVADGDKTRNLRRFYFVSSKLFIPYLFIWRLKWKIKNANLY